MDSEMLKRITVVALLLVAATVAAAGQKKDRPLLGVQRWDMYCGNGATHQQELGYLPGKQGFLKDPKWHDRAPFFYRLTKDVEWKYPKNQKPEKPNQPRQ